MAKPTTRQELIDYCLRRLGAPVLEINVDDDQVDDLVDDTIQFLLHSLVNTSNGDGLYKLLYLEFSYNLYYAFSSDPQSENNNLIFS